MAKTSEGHILNQDLENKINANISGAHKYVRQKQSMIENAVSERPFEFVIGAFIGGLILGALISKKG